MDRSSWSGKVFLIISIIARHEKAQVTALKHLEEFLLQKVGKNFRVTYLILYHVTESPQLRIKGKTSILRS